MQDPNRVHKEGHQHSGPHGPSPQRNEIAFVQELRTVKTVEEAENIAGFRAKTRGDVGPLVYVGVFEGSGPRSITLAYRSGPSDSDLAYVTTDEREIRK
jgi:hypothetical protein